MAPSKFATVLGSTGLVGAQILNHLLLNPQVATVSTLTRRPSPNPIIDPNSKLQETINSSSETWPTELPSLLFTPGNTVLFSGLGTTRADAGGLDAQRKIDYQLNLDLAKAARAAGVKTYVLISSMGANSASWAPYSVMKGQLDDEVSALGFEKCVIVRPGLIVGNREHKRLLEVPMHALANILGSVSPKLKDIWAQDASVIGRAAVRAGLDDSVWEGRKTVDGKNGGKIWIMSQAEIVELGKE